MITLRLPPGKLGVDIQRCQADGSCIVIGKTSETSPLQVGDVIESLNGAVLANVLGGLSVWVQLIGASANHVRTVVVRRRVEEVVDSGDSKPLSRETTTCHPDGRRVVKIETIDSSGRVIRTEVVEHPPVAHAHSATAAGYSVGRAPSPPSCHAYEGGRCGCVVAEGGLIWNCESCQRTCPPGHICAICDACFQSSDHWGHKVHVYHAVQGGPWCDCGNVEAWSVEGMCLRHCPPGAKARNVGTKGDNNRNFQHSSPKPKPPPPPQLKLKAKSPFPLYDDLAKVKFDLGPIHKREKSGFSSSWAKFKEDANTPVGSSGRFAGATINGHLVNEAQVVFMVKYFGVRIRAHTHYWYDRDAGFFGKIGGICKSLLDPRLSVLGDLDPNSSAGDTWIFVNGRQILEEEHKNWKETGIALDATNGFGVGWPYRYRVDPLGDVTHEPTGTYVCNWRKKYGEMLRKYKAVAAGGAALVGAAFLGIDVIGMLGGDVLAEGLVEGGAAGGGDIIYASDATGVVSGSGDMFYASDATGAASNFDSSGAGYVMFDDGSSASIGL